MVNEGGETMGDKVQTWRVVRETDDGMERTETLNVTATASAAWPWEVVTDDGAASGRTPRDAVVRMARLYMWTVTEILAPGEPTRAELAVEVERLRAENATLRASTDAAVDGVRAMLPAALKVAREEGSAELRALMAGRTTRPTREEFDALAEIGATLRVRWPGGDDEIPTHGDYYWTAIATVPEGARWWAHGANGALIEWPKVTP